MKKTFNLKKGKDFIWTDLVELALKHSDTVKFNILFTGQELNDFMTQFENGIKIIKDDLNKFYYYGEVLEISLSKNNFNKIKNLPSYNYWKNNFIEDPSFWVENDEILGSISHENLIMIDLNYFHDQTNTFDLYSIMSR